MTKPDPYTPLLTLAKQSLEDLSRLSKVQVGIARAIREADPASSDPTQLLVRKLKAIHVGTTSVDALKLPTTYDALKEWVADFEVNIRDKDSRLRRLIDPLGLLDAIARPSETTTHFDASMPLAGVQQGIALQVNGDQAFGKFVVINQRSAPARYRFSFDAPSNIDRSAVEATFQPDDFEVPAERFKEISLTIRFKDPEHVKTLPNRIEFRVDVREKMSDGTEVIASTVWVIVTLRPGI